MGLYCILKDDSFLSCWIEFVGLEKQHRAYTTPA